MADITIYLGNKKYSSWSLRPWLALKQTGANFDEVTIPLNQPDTPANIRRFSPSGRLPVLRYDQVTVWESLAICEYLAEQFPATRLWPEAPAARAFARAICNEIHGGFVDLRGTLPMDLANRWPIGDRLPKVHGDVDRVAAIWREARERFGGSAEFLFGEFSIADAMYAPVVTRFVTYGVPLDGACQAYVEAVMAWPPMQEWLAAALAEPWSMDFEVNTSPP